jgi:hypothetical protein
MREYVLWGTPKGETDPLHERPLTCTTDREHLATVRTLATADGWHSFRVQLLDGSLPDFVGCIAP